jgi:hypothetical protein
MNNKIDVRFRIAKKDIQELVQLAVPTSMSEMSNYYLITYECDGPDVVISLMTLLCHAGIQQIAA